MSQTVQLNRNSYLQDFDLILKKGKSEVVNVFGQIFYCVESSQKFRMQWDSNGLITMEVGRGFALRGDDYFEQLTFINETSETDITLTFSAGRAEVFDTRLNTLVDRQIAVGTIDSPTRVVRSAGNLAVNGILAIPGTNAGNRRKLVLIFNKSADDDLEVLDSNGAAAGTVWPRSTLPIETGDDLKIQNSGANIITYRVLELYYTLA